MIRQKSFQVLLKKGLTLKHKTYICNECLHKYKNDVNELGKLISSNIFQDGRLNISQQHKRITILNETEPFSWKVVRRLILIRKLMKRK